MINNINPSNPTNFQESPADKFYVSHIMANLLCGLESFMLGSSGSQGILQTLLSSINSSSFSAQIKNQLKDAITPALSANPNPKVIFQAIGHIIQTLSTIDPNLRSADSLTGCDQYYSNQLISGTTDPTADVSSVAEVLVIYAEASFPKTSTNWNTIKADLNYINENLDKPDKLNIYITELSRDLMPVLTQGS